VFPIFWSSLKIGGVDYGLEQLNKAIATGMSGLTDVAAITDYVYLTGAMAGFVNEHRDRMKKWKILETEEEHRVDFGEYEYAFKPDLVIEEQGEIALVDTKFVYEFYDPSYMELAPQLPRYAGALRSNGINVRKAYYAFIRTRKVKGEGEGSRYKLATVRLNNDKIKNSFRDLHNTALEIIDKKQSLSVADWRNATRRTTDKSTCKYCWFQELCVAEFNGSDGKLIRHTSYETSTYGYEEKEDD
jgi:CRISPR/Cas system-associated exonuclease Cas4 (RecB family)